MANVINKHHKILAHEQEVHAILANIRFTFDLIRIKIYQKLVFDLLHWNEWKLAIILGNYLLNKSCYKSQLLPSQ